tara:strand:+ start:192 stop:416 length:225 start_codon:yes stop_codon:yes gene_type:complete
VRHPGGAETHVAQLGLLGTKTSLGVTQALTACQLDGRQKIEEWRRHDNENRPRTALGYVMPKEFSSSFQACLRR